MRSQARAHKAQGAASGLNGEQLARLSLILSNFAAPVVGCAGALRYTKRGANL